MKKLKIVLPLLILLLLTGCASKAEVRKNMEKYLEKRYEKKFVVEEPKLQGNETWGYHNYYAYAYPKEEPDTVFPITYNSSNKKYNDSYFAQKWTGKGVEITNKEIEEIYGCEVYIWKYLFSYRASQIDKDFDKIKNLSHNELLEKYGRDCVRDVGVAIFLNRPYNREKEAELIDKLYNKLFCNREMGSFLFNVAIVDNKHNKVVIKYLDEIESQGYGFIGKRDWEKAGFIYMAFKDMRFSRTDKGYSENINEIKEDFKKYEEE